MNILQKIRALPAVVKNGIIIGMLAFVLGLAYPLISEWLVPEPPTVPEPRVTLPQQGESVQTDAFSVRLFHAAMKAHPEGNITLAPNALAVCLRQLQKLSSPDLTAGMQALNLPQQLQASSATVHEAACLFVDSSATLKPATEENITYPVPFTGRLADAHRDINGRLSTYSGGGVDAVANSVTAPRGTRFIATAALSLKADWYVPMPLHETEKDKFNNADGSKTDVQLMKAKGKFRIAHDPQGKWVATALFLRNGTSPAAEEQDACALILIYPQEDTCLSVRPLAQQLQKEDYDAIRTALAHATPIAAEVSLPRFSMHGNTQSMAHIMHKLGLAALFAPTATYPALTEDAPFPLDAFYLQCDLHFAECEAEPGSPLAPLGIQTKLKFTRPFIWMLTPLTSPHAPYAMGVLDNM